MRRQLILTLGLAFLLGVLPASDARLATESITTRVAVPEYMIAGYCGGGSGGLVPDKCCISCWNEVLALLP